MSELSNNCCLTIGDVTISIEGGFKGNRQDVQPNYRPFLKTGKPALALRLHHPNGLPSTGKPIFDNSPIWQLYRANGKSVFKIFDPMPGLSRALVLPSEPEHADLYFAHPAVRFLDPFYGPAMELLMIQYLAGGKGVILHACGIERDGKGYLFAGESGAGKSTLARLWNRHTGTGAQVLSDDRTIVRQRQGEYWMYGTPWHGEAKFGSPRGVKLKKIFFLRHASRNAIQTIAGAAAVTRFLQCSFPPYWDGAGMEFSMRFFNDLAAAVACQVLDFIPDEGVIEFLCAIK